MAEESFKALFANQLTENEARELLINLYQNGESEEEIAAAASVMRSHAIALHVKPELQERLVDVVGTGGDKSGSFNISSTVALLLASAGCYVAKHGNKAITSKSGSADMLEALGINLNLSPEKQAIMLEETGFTFMFAVNHHPAMKHIMPIRRSLDHRSIFNILGPLTNPAGVKRYLLGVFDPSFITKIANALRLLDSPNSLVVSSKDGMDEISISDITYGAKVRHGLVTEIEIDPQALGLKKYPFEAILGADASTNASITQSILAGKEEGAKRDVVLLNAAAALEVEGMARDMQEGLEIARDTILSGKATQHLAKIIKVSGAL